MFFLKICIFYLLDNHRTHHFRYVQSVVRSVRRARRAEPRANLARADQPRGDFYSSGDFSSDSSDSSDSDLSDFDTRQVGVESRRSNSSTVGRKATPRITVKGPAKAKSNVSHRSKRGTFAMIASKVANQHQPSETLSSQTNTQELAQLHAMVSDLERAIVDRHSALSTLRDTGRAGVNLTNEQQRTQNQKRKPQKTLKTVRKATNQTTNQTTHQTTNETTNQKPLRKERTGAQSQKQLPSHTTKQHSNATKKSPKKISDKNNSLHHHQGSSAAAAESSVSSRGSTFTDRLNGMASSLSFSSASDSNANANANINFNGSTFYDPTFDRSVTDRHGSTVRYDLTSSRVTPTRLGVVGVSNSPSNAVSTTTRTGRSVVTSNFYRALPSSPVHLHAADNAHSVSDSAATATHLSSWGHRDTYRDTAYSPVSTATIASTTHSRSQRDHRDKLGAGSNRSSSNMYSGVAIASASASANGATSGWQSSQVSGLDMSARFYDSSLFDVLDQIDD